jgi:hypothetical protein
VKAYEFIGDAFYLETAQDLACVCGADIVNQAILEANARPQLVSERILVQTGDGVEGNGHTLAVEATFNNKIPAPAGWTPPGLALRERWVFADDLPPVGQTLDEAKIMRGALDERWLGMSGMRERAKLLGGRLTIESAPGAGTTVFVEMPLDGERGAHGR